MTIAGQTFSVTQAGVACTFTISPTTSTLSSSGASWNSRPSRPAPVAAGRRRVTPRGSRSPWRRAATVMAPSPYSVAANTGRQRARGSCTIGGQSFSVTQPARRVSRQSRRCRRRCRVNRGKRSGDGDRTRGVQLDRDEQRRLDHGRRGTSWNRQWNGGLQCRRKHEQCIAHGNADDRRQRCSRLRNPVRLACSHLAVLVDPDVTDGGGWDGHSQQRRRLQLDRDEQRLVDHHYVGRQRSRRRLGELLGRIEHGHDIPLGDDDYRWADVHSDPGLDVMLFTISPTSQVFPAGGGTGTVTVTTSVGLQLDRIQQRRVGDDLRRHDRNRIGHGHVSMWSPTPAPCRGPRR